MHWYLILMEICPHCLDYQINMSYQMALIKEMTGMLETSERDVE